MHQIQFIPNLTWNQPLGQNMQQYYQLSSAKHGNPTISNNSWWYLEEIARHGIKDQQSKQKELILSIDCQWICQPHGLDQVISLQVFKVPQMLKFKGKEIQEITWVNSSIYAIL